VDELNEGEINVDNMRGFLKRAGHYPTEEEVIAIIRRVDTNADSSISYAEFSEAIKP
jgi:Ca2+-binding EF-hand superfamily protein